MRLTIERSYTFEASHWLPIEGHKCSTMHGHTYRVKIEIAGEVDDHGWIMDFSDVDALVNPIIAKLDHNCLNAGLDKPTAENICLLFYWLLIDDLPGLASVTVHETDRGAARLVVT